MPRKERFKDYWDSFFYAHEDPMICSVMRIGLAILILVYLLTNLGDVVLWFGDSGVLPYDVSRKVVDPDTGSVFHFLPKSDLVAQICYGVFIVQTLLLLLGVKSRFQCACIFIWLVSFQHRNILLHDGEDAVFRIIAFLLIFLPLDARWSLEKWFRGLPNDGKQSLWALRLIQIEVVSIFYSTAWLKLDGVEWLNGTALYYISRLDDLFGRFWIPDFILENLVLLKVLTVSVLLFELIGPILVWSSKLRPYVLVGFLVFHLSTDYAMNLFLFHWVMILGWISFLNHDQLLSIGQNLRSLSPHRLFYRVTGS